MNLDNLNSMNEFRNELHKCLVKDNCPYEI